MAALWKACSSAAIALALLSLASPQAQTPAVLAFTGARLVDGTGSAPIDNGVLVVQNGKVTDIGTDSGPAGRFQGYFEHMELEMMVKAGLTPMQAIVAATDDAATCIRKHGIVGSLHRGAYADLVVYRQDPTRDIRATHSIESVWIAGRRLD